MLSEKNNLDDKLKYFSGKHLKIYSIWACNWTLFWWSAWGNMSLAYLVVKIRDFVYYVRAFSKFDQFIHIKMKMKSKPNKPSIIINELF